MTIIRYRPAPDAPTIKLTTDRDPFEVLEHVRKRMFQGADDAAPDPGFEAAKRIQAPKP